MEKLDQLTISEITDILKNLEFKYEETSEQYRSPFFKEFSGLYNTDPILLRCSCKEPKRFSEIIESLHFFERLRNDILYLDINIVKSLITNVFLNPGPSPIAEFTDSINWKLFNTTCFVEINPLSFVLKLTELVETGGLFVKSKRSSNQLISLSLDFCNSIFKGGSQKFKIYYTFGEGWSSYFGKMGMGLDVTFFIFDAVLGEFWILSKTDYD